MSLAMPVTWIEMVSAISLCAGQENDQLARYGHGDDLDIATGGADRRHHRHGLQESHDDDHDGLPLQLLHGGARCREP